MSVFSIVKKGRQQAKERDAEAAQKGKAEPVKQPYKHVPTHAAIDAMSGSPSSWKHEDRPKIMAQNRRRSAIAASTIRTSGLPRVGSSLSHVSYPDVYNTPVVPLPKNYSFSSMPATWRSSDSQTDYFSHGGSLKGKEPASAAVLPRNTANSVPGRFSEREGSMPRLRADRDEQVPLAWVLETAFIWVRGNPVRLGTDPAPEPRA